MKDKILNLINDLINEHASSGYCTDYNEAQDWIEHDPVVAFDKFYDVGRYETLKNLWNKIKYLGE